MITLHITGTIIGQRPTGYYLDSTEIEYQIEYNGERWRSSRCYLNEPGRAVTPPTETEMVSRWLSARHEFTKLH